jgi:hypothetical protein
MSNRSRRKYMTTINALWRLVLLLVTLGLCAGAAVAEPDSPDQGAYQIVHARYGTPERNVDVTARLKELARGDLAFKLRNSTLGVDPAYGEAKTLRLYTRGPDGRQRIFDFREGAWIDGSQFTGWKDGDWGGGPGRERAGGWNDDYVAAAARPVDAGEYRILHAVYGTAENYIDVTRRLRELARQDTNFRMGNQTFGADPDRGKAKTLRIFARDAQGRDRTFEYAENHWVDGAQFIGWGRGDWGDNGGGHGNCRELRILKATYGAGARQSDVTEHVQQMVRDGHLQFKVTNKQLGIDPAPGDDKTLALSWCADGRTQQSSTTENGYVNMP